MFSDMRTTTSLLEEIGEDFGLRWSGPREVNTKQGLRIVRSAVPTEAFWTAWRKEKEALKARGISVSQYNGSWQVSEWTAPNGATKPAFEAKPWTVQPLQNTAGLLPYQVPAVENLVAALRSNNSALDASDTGTGKTYIALAAVRELGKSAVVVCPKSVIPSWQKAAAHIGVSVRVINYEKVRRGNTPYGSWFSKDQFRWSVDSDEVLIFDEVHRCKGHKTQNGLLLQAAKRGGFTTIALSATAATNPLEMKGLGYVLGLHQLKGFWDWTCKYGARPSRWGGFEFVGGKEDLAKLHAAIFPRKGNRVRVADLGDAFPETQIHTQLVNLGEDTARKVDEIFEEMKESLEELKKRSAGDELGNHLTVRLRARQRTELLKVPAFVELAEDFVEQGHSVAIFVSFNETLTEIRDRLAADHTVVVIHGSQTDAERQSAIDTFQSDAARVIICNIRAGGVGVSLHDLHGKHARVALISPTDSAVDLRQTLGRVHRAGGKTKSIQRIIGVAGSVEEKVLRNVEEKLENLDALNDGDLTVA